MAWQQIAEEVIRQRGDALIGYASLFVPEIKDAEDLVQEALLKTFSRPRTFRDAAAAEGYVRSAIRTTFLDGYRRNRSWESKRHLVATEDLRPGPEEVAAVLRTLPPRERACAVLRFYDDLTVPAIAAELGLAEGAVKRYLSDATATLRQALAPAPQRPTSPTAQADAGWGPAR